MTIQFAERTYQEALENVRRKHNLDPTTLDFTKEQNCEIHSAVVGSWADRFDSVNKPAEPGKMWYGRDSHYFVVTDDDVLREVEEGEEDDENAADQWRLGPPRSNIIAKQGGHWTVAGSHIETAMERYMVPSHEHSDGEATGTWSSRNQSSDEEDSWAGMYQSDDDGASDFRGDPEEREPDQTAVAPAV